MLGLWLLIPEHLRLGTWDLLCNWSGQGTENVEPRLALQLVHEAALCVTGVRQSRNLAQKGFELANGLPFVATDWAMHQLLAPHTVEESQQLQVTLGKLRLASGHYKGTLLAIDPHRLRSYSKRQMRRRQKDPQAQANKVAQTFFALDADTGQPVCFVSHCSATSVSQATPRLLRLAAEILNPRPGGSLVLADSEHFTAELLDHISSETNFDMLVPMPMRQYIRKQIENIPPNQFTPRWAGYATLKLPYQLTFSQSEHMYQFIERNGELPADWKFKSFLSTAERDEVPALTRDYPARWHVEEFFNANQALGWKRAGTLNLNIRYAQMTMALIAQAAIHQLRTRIGQPFSQWEASHLSRALFNGLDGDLRVTDDTIIITYYNAPNAEHLRKYYENLPEKLSAEGVKNKIPWLYDFKLDFRFR